MDIGILQSGPTCWFQSSLNLFLLSDNGFKIMWAKMREFYKGLSRPQRAFFNAPSYLACPFGNMRRQNLMDFWRFIDAYACVIGGPGNLKPLASNKTESVLAAIQFANASTREAKGLTAAYTQNEIVPILKHMGFEKDSDFAVLDTPRLFLNNVLPSHKFIIFRASPIEGRTQNIVLRNIRKNRMDYSLAAAGITIKWSTKKTGHAIAAFIRGRQGYIFDSDQQYGIEECDWWDPTKLQSYIKKRYGQFEYIRFTILVYTNKLYTSKIAPFCRRKYKKLGGEARNVIEYAKQTTQKTGEPFYNAAKNQLRKGVMAPLTRVALARQHGRLPKLTQNSFNSLVRQANSYQSGMEALKNLVRAGYTYNANGNNYKNFRMKLLNKFPNPAPANFYATVLRRGNANKYTTSNQYYKNLTNESVRLGYSLNKNSQAYKNFVSTVNRRTTGTRSAVKRTSSALAQRANNNGGSSSNKRNATVLVANNKKLLNNIIKKSEGVKMHGRKTKNALLETPIIRFKTKENIQPFINHMFRWPPELSRRMKTSTRAPGDPNGQNLKPNQDYYLIHNPYYIQSRIYKNRNIDIRKVFPLNVGYYSSYNKSALANKNILNKYVLKKNL